MTATVFALTLCVLLIPFWFIAKRASRMKARAIILAFALASCMTFQHVYETYNLMGKYKKEGVTTQAEVTEKFQTVSGHNTLDMLRYMYRDGQGNIHRGETSAPGHDKWLQMVRGDKLLIEYLSTAPDQSRLLVDQVGVLKGLVAMALFSLLVSAMFLYARGW